MKNAFAPALSATAIIGLLFGFSHDAYANVGLYLQLLHNNSSETVRIKAKVPAGWVGVPHYPIKVKPGHSLFDEKFYDQAFYKLCRHKIHNVAIPPGGSCSKDTHMTISVGKKYEYKLHDCDWKIHIHVKKKSGGKWKLYKTIKIENKPVFFWRVTVKPDGRLFVGEETKDLKKGDEHKDN